MNNNLPINNTENTEGEESKGEVFSAKDLERGSQLIEKQDSLKKDASNLFSEKHRRENEILKSDPQIQELTDRLKDLKTQLQVTEAEYAVVSRSIEKQVDENLDWNNIPVVEWEHGYVDWNNNKEWGRKTFWIIIDDPNWREFKVENELSTNEYWSSINVTRPDGTSIELSLGEMVYKLLRPEYNENWFLRGSEDPRYWGERKDYEDENQIGDGVYAFLESESNPETWDIISDKESLIKFFTKNPRVLEYYIKK
jgi:hypothetical protein